MITLHIDNTTFTLLPGSAERARARMKRLLIQLAQATLAAAIIGGPLFYYFIFVMTP